jgi:carbon starvation protein
MIIIVFGFWQPLWVLFAGANQLLAAIVLLLASSWLVKLGKSYWWTLIPSLTLFVTAMAALFYSAIYQALYQQILLSQSENPVSFIGNLVTISIGLLFMILGAYLFFAGWQQMNRSHSNQG